MSDSVVCRGAGAGGAGAGAGAHTSATTTAQQQHEGKDVDFSSGLHVFWGSGSPPAWRTLMCVHEKSLKYTSHLLSFGRGDTKSPQFRKINPRGMVPVLTDDGVIVGESLATLIYLERYYPSTPLLPADKKECGRALQLMHEANNVSSVSGEVVYYLRRTPPHAINVEYLAAKRAAMHQEIALWEGYLEGRTYLVGSSLTLADVSFFPSLAYNVRLGFNIERYPNLHKYYQTICSRPSVTATWPPHWKGTQGLPILSDAVPGGASHGTTGSVSNVSGVARSGVDTPIDDGSDSEDDEALAPSPVGAGDVDMS